MRNRIRHYPVLITALIAAFGGLYVAGAATTDTTQVNKSVMDGPYSVTLKVQPAEYFAGPKATMIRDGGAGAVPVNGVEHPNHHLVVFVDSKLDKPLDHAAVAISYCETSPQTTQWTPLPTARMYIKGLGVGTTHYGNNVKLEAGSYNARVVVNGKTVTIPFTLPQG